LNITGGLSVLRTLADRMSALQASLEDLALRPERPSLTVGLLTRPLDGAIDSPSKVGLAFDHYDE
ncbi:MAG: hypothetical protein QOI77_3730, partial [Blastocatellia bacterium]|nr:hypothetical protein [Blastocatellia bacterium]